VLQGQLVPASLIVLVTGGFIAWERVRPGRTLPSSPGWHARALLLNVLQLALTIAGGVTWNRYFRDHALLHFPHSLPPAAEGALYWLAGTFVFYWWHRLRHAQVFWLALHQVHHSPSRLELLTSFYKHPAEIVADAVLTALLVYGVCGASAAAGAWTALFGATGEYFYHSNLRTPRWVGWFLQRPEHHCLHHALDVHTYNFGDVTWWDRLFGTFRDVGEFEGRCGFPGRQEERLGEMLLFKDVYGSSPSLR
jgi:sterol desaturase/sphingolipid hydroxylase (fatty acid hydroxylase superfamily)